MARFTGRKTKLPLQTILDGMNGQPQAMPKMDITIGWIEWAKRLFRLEKNDFFGPERRNDKVLLVRLSCI